MTPLEAAAHLCRLTGSANLAIYLGASRDTPPRELRVTLSMRRRRLQAMMHNPKHGAEARFVVRNGALLSEALDDLQAHLQDMTSRAEAQHLPAIEMMLRGMLTTGELPPSRLRRLRDGALELGVRPETFDQLWRRLAPARTAVTRPASTRRPARRPGVQRRPGAHARLRLREGATSDDLDAAYIERSSEATTEAERRRLQIAYRVLSHPAARQRYESGYAPVERPVPQRPARSPVPLRIVGPRIREIPMDRPDLVEIEVGVDVAGRADVLVDEAWLMVATASIDLAAPEPRFDVWVDRQRLPWSAGAASVRVRWEGHEASVEYRTPHFLFRMGRSLSLV
ncbi:MAG: hypothetical protein KTR31_30970 [Myxococcales bacterium]|nr:hypothetical protein [Myxococcales bacterium]